MQVCILARKELESQVVRMDIHIQGRVLQVVRMDMHIQGQVLQCSDTVPSFEPALPSSSVKPVLFSH